MASNKIIEDALMKPMSESDVSAIVGSLESHLASATSLPEANVDVSRGPATIAIPAALNHDGVGPRPILQALTPAVVRARANGPTIVRATSSAGGSVAHLPIRQQNPIQLVTLPNANATIRGRGVVTMLPTGATLQGGTMNSASGGNVPRLMGRNTVVLGANQVRVTQPTVVQPGQGVGSMSPHIFVNVKTSDGNFQLVPLAAPAATNAGPLHVPASMASPLGPFRFQANPTPGTIRASVPSHQLPQTLSQPTIVGGSQSIVVRSTAPSLANLPSRSPTPVAVVQPQPQPQNQPASHLQQPGPPPLIQQNRVIPVGGNQQGGTPRATAPTSSASSTSGTSSASGSGQMPPEMAKTKCKNFLATLLRLANDQPATTARNVRNLIQGLVDGVVVPEDFTTRLQEELNSSPQPCLVPFLKKSLPYLRHSLATNEMQIEGVTPPPLSSVALPTSPGVTFQRNRTPVPTQVRVTTTKAAPPRPGMTAVNVRLPAPVSANASQPPGLTPRSSLDGGSVPFNHETMSLSQFPTALKVMTPTQNVQSLPSPHAPSPVSGSAPTPPPTTPSGGKSKAKPKAVTNGVASPKNQTPKNQKTVNGVKLDAAGAKSLKPSAKKTTPAAASSTPASNAGAGAVRKDEVDDINDVAAMGGVNLLEESQRILGSTEFIGTVARSCQDVMTLDSEALASKVAEICQSKGLDPSTISSDVLLLISHATEEMVKTQLAKLSHAAQHRMDVFKFNPLYEQCQDVRGQIRFLENVEKGEKRRHEEQEREILIRAAKSRAKVEDPERAKLREKAKELQRAEQEEIRQREANLTALQAIGPRKKAKLEGTASTSLGSSPSMTSSNSSTGPSSMMFRPRVKRVNMRDLVFVWENDKDRCRGFDLYKVLLNK